MFKNLKTQLLTFSIVTVLLLLVTIRQFTRGFLLSAMILAVVVCVIIIAVNLWFLRSVSDPLEELSIFAKRIADGNYGSIMKIARDDEVGKLAGEINDMSRKVAAAEKTRTDFVSQISHELRTPLTAITGWAETIAFDPALEADSKRGIQIISKEAERLTGMVTELLEFTRIQDGRFELNIEEIDIAAELEDTIFTLNELFKQSETEVNYDSPDEDIPPIPGDPERLRQVFINLLDNAVKHGGDGKKIDVRLSSDDVSAIITIRDYGHGIPEDELPHVKEKFYKGSSKNHGSGIGLAVCDEIIARHNGWLDIVNAPGGGCMVIIRLPLAQI